MKSPKKKSRSIEKARRWWLARARGEEECLGRRVTAHGYKMKCSGISGDGCMTM